MANNNPGRWKNPDHDSDVKDSTAVCQTVSLPPQGWRRCPPLWTVPRLVLRICNVHHLILLLAACGLFDASRGERSSCSMTQLGGIGTSKRALQAASSDLKVSSIKFGVCRARCRLEVE